MRLLSLSDTFDRVASMTRVSFRLGFAQFRDEWPVPIAIIGDLVPETIRMAVFCLIGYVAGGVDAMHFAWVGSIVLVVANTCVSHTTDIATLDSRVGVIPVLQHAPIPLLVQYLCRATPLALMALTKALVVAVAVGVALGQQAWIPQAVASLWVVLPAMLGATMLSFALISPTLGTGWEHLVYNVATAVLTVASGAVINVSHLPGIDWFGTLLPLHHSVLAFRDLVGGTATWESALAHTATELLVALVWSAIAALAFALRLHYGRRTGQMLT